MTHLLLIILYPHLLLIILYPYPLQVQALLGIIFITNLNPLMSLSTQERARVSQNIVTLLKNTQNVSAAINATIQRDPENAYSYYKYIRQKIFHDDEFRNPNYLQRLRDFQHAHFRPYDHEWSLLEDLYHSPLCYQYRVETARKAYLPDTPDLDKALKQIRSIADPFYEYIMPEDVVERAIEREREARELKHTKAVTISDLQTIISKARAWRACKENPWQLVACALFLCGRRVIEIISTLEWERDGEFTARVTGIAKQDMGDEPAVIPLLCSYDDFDELMWKIRAVQLPAESHTHRLKPAFVLYFGQWYNHSQRRNIYGEAAFRSRAESEFYPGMSKVMWIDKALCHTSNVIQQASNLTYQSLVFNDE